MKIEDSWSLIADRWSVIGDRWSLIALDTSIGCTLCRVINCGTYPPITHRLCLAPGLVSRCSIFLSILYAVHAALLINLRSWLLGIAPTPLPSSRRYSHEFILVYTPPEGAAVTNQLTLISQLQLLTVKKQIEKERNVAKRNEWKRYEAKPRSKLSAVATVLSIFSRGSASKIGISIILNDLVNLFTLKAFD